MSDEMVLRPPINRAMRSLDRAFFKKTFPMSAARIPNNKDISVVRKTLEKSRDLAGVPRLAVVVVDPMADLAAQGRKCVMLRPDIKHDDQSTWSPTLAELHKDGRVGVIPYDLTLEYDYWTYEDIMTAILPEDDQENLFPSRFSQVGHIIHLNLRKQHEPYKQLIAQVLLDKTHNTKTVINKVDDVGQRSEFRTFSYEVLCGPDEMNVEVYEEGCTFKFDYSKVYWNARLQAEHKRLIDSFNEGEAVCDVMAGIGPFAIPAGKKRVFVSANDLNPMSYECMEDARVRNKVGDFVRTFNMDGHEFIRKATADLMNTQCVVKIPAANSRGKSAKPAKAPESGAPKSKPAVKTLERPQVYSHYVMNLPASAIDFLPDFIGLYTSKSEGLDRQKSEDYFAQHKDVKLPMVHVYCFGPKNIDEREAIMDVCGRISERLGYDFIPETPETEIYDVRDVAPNKRMFCVSFRLPAEVAFRES